MDKTVTATPGIKPAILMGGTPASKSAVARTRIAANPAAKTAAVVAPAVPEGATVEIIRGDKRAHEIVRQEQ
jgi:hypothetical protein